MEESMVGSIFETVGDVITSYLSAISGMFANLIKIFYVPETGLTLMGILLLIGLGIGVVKWGFNLVYRLIRL